MTPPTPTTTAFLAFASVFILLFTVADARLPYDLRVKEPKTTSRPFPNTDPILLLPSDKPAATHTEKLDADQFSKLLGLTKEETLTEEVPVPLVRFRPISRHFAIRPINPHISIHGQTVRGLRPWTPRYGRIRHLPYANDDVLTTAAVSGSQDLIPEDRRPLRDSTNLPVRWRQADYNKYKRPVVIDLGDDVIFQGDQIKKPQHHHDGSELQHENLILNKIRKFLHQF